MLSPGNNEPLFPPCICIVGGRVLGSVLIMLGYISPRDIYIMMSPTLSRSQYNVSLRRIFNPNIVILIAVEIFMCKMCNQNRFIGTELRWNCRVNCWPFIFIFSLIAHKCYSVPVPLSHSGPDDGKETGGRSEKTAKLPFECQNRRTQWIFQNNMPRNPVSYFESWSYRNYN